MSLEIICDNESKAYRPGDTISGRMRWRCDEAPQWVEIRLFYYTEGKGTQDIGVVETIRENNCPLSGEKSFAFTAPNHPTSCSGKLVSIRWALELVSNNNEPIPKVNIIIAPEAQEIKMGSAD